MKIFPNQVSRFSEFYFIIIVSGLVILRYTHWSLCTNILASLKNNILFLSCYAQCNSIKIFSKQLLTMDEA